MAKKQRAVVFAEGGKKNTFVISGPDAVEEARALVRSVGGTYHLEGFTAVEQAAIHPARAANPVKRGRKPEKMGFGPVVLKRGYLYLGDNGRCFCMDHAGTKALYTGHDLSGQKLYRLKKGEEEGLECEGCAAADRHRKGNPTDSRDMDDARDLLTKTFGYHAGLNADWMDPAWFVQGSGGTPNPNRPDVDPGLYETKSIWVVEDPEEGEFCVYYREIEEEQAEDEELMRAPATDVQSVIDAARNYARDLFGKQKGKRKGKQKSGTRRGNPFQSSREYAGLSYAHLVSKQDALARRTGGMPWPRLNGIPMSPAQIMIREIRETRRRMGPAATLLQAAHRVAENHPDIAYEAMDMIGVKGAQEPELAALQSVWPGIRRSNPTSKTNTPPKKTSKQKQFGSSVTPALQGLVRDVTGKACYQETCFVGRG